MIADTHAVANATTHYERFLTALWPAGIPSGEQLVITRILNGKVSSWGHPTVADACAAIAAKTYGTTNLYLGIATRRGDLEPWKGRGGDDDCLTWPCWGWADIDYGPGHAGQMRITDRAEAETVIADLEHQPDIVVHTGHGFHCYWLGDRYYGPAEMAGLLPALANTVCNVWPSTAGKADPAVYSLDRIMRIPGTYNDKKSMPRVRVELIKP